MTPARNAIVSLIASHTEFQRPVFKTSATSSYIMTSPIKYIFCINTGRSGSKYLTEIFSHVPNCISLHEPEPIGNKKVMRKFLNGDISHMRELSKLKIQAIQSADINSLYVETNHCFIKGWGWFIPEHISQNEIGVIILDRDANEISKSLMRLLCSPLLKRGQNWMICPDIKSPLTQPPYRFISAKISYLLLRFVKKLFKRKPSSKKILPTTPDWLSQYELECCNWYISEVGAMAERYKNRFPDIKYYDVNLNEINSIKGINSMLSYFGFSADETVNDIINKKINTKSRHGKNVIEKNP